MRNSRCMKEKIGDFFALLVIVPTALALVIKLVLENRKYGI